MLRSLSRCKCGVLFKMEWTYHSPKLLSSSSSTSMTDDSWTISHIKTSLGLSFKSIIDGAHFAHSESSGEHSSVLEFFQKHGFSEMQIKKLVKNRPQILLANVERSLRPKVDFLVSIGLSKEDCTRIITTDPYLLFRSVENKLSKSFDTLKSLMGSEKLALDSIRRYPPILRCDISRNWKLMALSLKDVGIPESQIVQFITRSPSFLIKRHDRLSEVALRLKEMGFDPSSLLFIRALYGTLFVNETTWKRKLETYKSLGFSDDQIDYMFRKQCSCLFFSEKRIREAVAFYFKKFHLSPSQLSKMPNVLLYSLKRRVTPRCSVLQVLWSKGVVQKRINLFSLLKIDEKAFLKAYVNKHEAEFPEVLAAYKGKMKFDEYSFPLVDPEKTIEL